MVTLSVLVGEQFSYILTNCCQRKVKIILCEVYQSGYKNCTFNIVK